MIARQAIPQPRTEPKPPPRVAVRAREASLQRARRSRIRGYGMLARIVVGMSVLLVPVMLYVLLMGNLTAENFTLANVTQQKLDLVAETTRLDDRIAQLESRERLTDVAARLHMHDPQVYAVVDVPRPQAAPPSNGIAFLGAFFHR